jgi:hypothetical protein
MKKYGDAYSLMYDEGQTIFYEDDGTYYKKKSYFNSDDGVSQVNASKYEIAGAFPCFSVSQFFLSFV